MHILYLLLIKPSVNVVTSLNKYVIVFITSHHREFIRLIKRPFAVRYNAITSSVEVLNSAHSLQSAVSQLQAELAIIGDALKKLTSQEIVYDETKKPNGYKGANDTTPRSRSSSYCDVIKE